MAVSGNIELDQSESDPSFDEDLEPGTEYTFDVQFEYNYPEGKLGTVVLSLPDTQGEVKRTEIEGTGRVEKANLTVTETVPDDMGGDNFTVSVTLETTNGTVVDGDDASYSVDSDDNTPPEIRQFTPTDDVVPLSEGEAVDFRVESSDADGDELSHTWSVADLNGNKALQKVSTEDGSRSNYRRVFDEPGDYRVQAKVSDGRATDTHDWIIEVTEKHRLSVEVSGEGSGEIKAAPPGISTSSIDREYQQGTVVSLTPNPGAGSQFVEWEGDIGSADPNKNVLEIPMDQDRVITAQFEQLDPAEFEITTLEPADVTLTEGKSRQITATIRNTGDQQATKPVNYTATASRLESHTQRVSLSPGDEQTLAFEINTSGVSTGDYRQIVSTPDDQRQGEITIENPEPAVFEINSLVPENIEVKRDEQIQVTATIQNTGGEQATKAVNYSTTVPTLESRTQRVSLSPGDKQTLTFELNTSGIAPGEYSHTVSTSNGQIEGQLTIKEVDPAVFILEGLTPQNRTLTRGTQLEITATIRNTGDRQAQKLINYNTSFPPDENQTNSMTLDSGSEQTITFEVNTSDVSPGKYRYSVSTPDDQRRGEITIESPEPPVFEINSWSPENIEVKRDEQIQVTATIQNTGGKQATKSVTYQSNLTGGDATATQTQTVTLKSGASTTIAFDPIQTADVQPDEYTHTVSTPDDKGTGQITVIEPEPAEFTLVEFSPREEQLTSGDQLEVTATIENTGGKRDTRTVEYELELSGSSVDITETREATLDPGDERELVFSVNTSDIQPGEYEHSVSTPDDETEGQVQIDDRSSIEIMRVTPQQESIRRGERLILDTVVKNTGKGRGSTTLTLSIENRTIGQQTRSVNPESRATVKIESDPITNLDPARYVFEVTSQDGSSETGTVQIQQSPPPEIREILTPDQYVSGEKYTLRVKYDQPNPTPVTARLLIDGRQVAEKDVNESKQAASLSHSFEPGQRTMVIELEDAYRNTVSEEFLIDVKGKGPVINDYGPANLQLRASTGDKIGFSIKYEHTENQRADIIWRDESGGTLSRGARTLTEEFLNPGNRTIKAIVRDESGREASRSWTVKVERFRAPPNIEDQITSDIVSIGDQTEIVTVSVRNPSVNQRQMDVELRAENPDGIRYIGTGDITSGDRAQLVSTKTVEPGDQDTLEMNIQADQSRAGDTVSINYSVLYAPVDTPKDVQTGVNGSISALVAVSTETPAGNDSLNLDIPGFGVVTALIAVLSAALLAVGGRRAIQ